MPDTEFTDEEVAAFNRWFEKTQKWSYWRRLDGEHGEDVLEVGIEDRGAQTLKLARSERFGYMITGFGGWGLTVCDEFSEVLAILSSYQSPSLAASQRRCRGPNEPPAAT
jgi:hypothetical protein